LGAIIITGLIHHRQPSSEYGAIKTLKEYIIKALEGNIIKIFKTENPLYDIVKRVMGQPDGVIST
jgi:hypothetical protein